MQSNGESNIESRALSNDFVPCTVFNFFKEKQVWQFRLVYV